MTHVSDCARDHAQEQIKDLHHFDYGAAAELFSSRGKHGRSKARYLRFDTAAEAIRFAIEEMPRPLLLGASLEVDEARFGSKEIHYLYNNSAYPLKRVASSDKEAKS